MLYISKLKHNKMKSIKFSDEQLEFLREQYTDELANAEKYVEQVKEILKKLGAEVKASKIGTEQPVKVEKKRGRKPKVAVAEVKEPKKRGRKPKVVATVADAPVETPVKPEKKTKSKKAATSTKKQVKAKGKSAEKRVAKRSRKPVVKTAVEAPVAVIETPVTE